MATMTSSQISPKTSFPTDYNSIFSEIFVRKRATWSMSVKNSRRKEIKMPKKAKGLRRRFTLSAESVIPKIDVGKSQVRISSLNVLDLKTHRIVIQTRKYKNRNITQHRLAPSPHPRKTTKKTSFAATLTQRSSISPTVCQV